MCCADEQMMAAHILRLSDEILVHIFNFVPFIDRRSLRDVCERFRTIIEDKTFYRYVDLSYCYRVSLSSLKYLLTSASCKNIQVLNINGCYWIPRADLMTIGKLVNLKELHVLHCKVTLKLLLSITKSMSLVGLSWTVTWMQKEEICVDDYMESALRNIFGQLDELIIHLKVFNCFESSMKFVMLILSYCANLQMLEVRHISCTFLVDQIIQEAADPDLKKLRSLKVEFGSHSESMHIMFNFCMKVLTSSTQGKNWLNLWLPGCGSLIAKAMRLKRFELIDLTNAKALYIDGGTNFNAAGASEPCEFKCRKLGIQNTLSEDCMEFIVNKFADVKEIIMQDCRIDSEEEISIFTMMSVRWKNITHLNLISCYFPNKCQDVCTALANMKVLTHLCVNGCLIATNPIEVVGFQKDNENNFLKKRRIGLVIDSPDTLSVEENAGLGLLTKGCPLLEYLEISGTCSGRICKNGCPSLKDKDLNAIYRWEHLKSLTLKHLLNLKQCVFLIAICKNCPLQTLRLKAVGASGICTYNASLITAVRQCTHLLDFTIMQNYINMDSLFTALMECSKLVRVAVVDEAGSRSHAAMEYGLTKMFTRLQNLLVFYLTVTASTQWCRSCQTHLNTKFLEERPPLSIMISNSGGICDNVVYPDYHLQDMLYF